MNTKTPDNRNQYYTAVFWQLLRMYTAVLFGVNYWNGCIRSKKSGAEKKSLFKIILLLLLFIYIGACFTVFLGAMMMNIYRIFKPLGMQQLMFECIILTLFFFLFISNFLLMISVYFIGSLEQTFRAMPIPPRVLLASKFCAHCFAPVLFSLFFLTITAVIYGMYEVPPLFFYVVIFLGALLFPLPILGLCYMFLIIVMRFTRLLKNKQFVMIITAVFGLFLAVAINIMAQSTTGIHKNPAQALALIEKYKYLSAAFGFLLSGKLFAAALAAETSYIMLKAFIPFALVCIAIPAVLIAGFSRMHEKSLDGFDEKKLNKLTESESSRFIKSAFTRRSVFTALLLREIHALNREPVYVLNGPLTVVLFPVIFAIMYMTGSVRIPPDATALIQNGFGALFAGICGAFLGTTAGVASTAVSRDAKHLAVIKSLPVPLQCYMQAKLAHAMLFAVFGSAVGIGGIALLFPLSLSDCFIALLISLSLALLCNLLALLLDTVHPKLKWDSPAAAIKHNMNNLIMLLTDTILFGTAVAGAVLTSMPQWMYVLLFAVVPLLASGIFSYFFWSYTERKIQSLEV